MRIFANILAVSYPIECILAKIQQSRQAFRNSSRVFSHCLMIVIRSVFRIYLWLPWFFRPNVLAKILKNNVFWLFSVYWIPCGSFVIPDDMVGDDVPLQGHIWSYLNNINYLKHFIYLKFFLKPFRSDNLFPSKKIKDQTKVVRWSF